MGILHALRLASHVKVDKNDAQKTAQPLLDLLKQKQFDQSTAYMKGLAASTLERTLYGFSYQKGTLGLAQAWQKAQPDNAMTYLLLARCQQEEGWRVRGDDYAKNVPKSRMKKFKSLCETSEQNLLHALELEPTKPEIYASLIRGGMTLGHSLGTFEDWFNQGRANDPCNFPCFLHFQTALTEKWCGSHDAMFDFTRWAVENAPKENEVHALVPESYNEYALDIYKYNPKKIVKQLSTPENRAEVVNALYNWLDATPETLAIQLEKKQSPFKTYAINQFAVALYFTGAWDEAKPVYKALNGSILPFPWCWYPVMQRDVSRPGFVHDRFCRHMSIRL